MRYIIRKESFGGLAFDTLDKSNFYIDSFTYEILYFLKKNGIPQLHNEFDAITHNEREEIIKDLSDLNFLIDASANYEIIELSGTDTYLSAPSKLFLTITEFCNLKCKHCFGDYENKKHMRYQNFVKIIDEAKAIGVSEVSISGGEPLLHPEFCEFINYLIKSEMCFTLVSNGFAVHKEHIEVLKKAQSLLGRITISVDGSEKVNDAIRGAGTYAKVISNIKLMKSNGLKVNVNTVVNKNNYDKLDLMLHHLCNEGISNCSFSTIKPVGRAKETDLIFHDKSELKYAQGKASNQIFDFAKKTGISQYFNGLCFTPDGTQTIPDESVLIYLKNEGCGAGVLVASIDVDGFMTPCTFLNDYFDKRSLKQDSVFNTSILEVWHNSQQFQAIRTTQVSSFCSSCNHYKTRKCYGGCPAINDIPGFEISSPNDCNSYEVDQ